MFELNRIRLHYIGPDEALYDDVLLDLSDGGEPVSAPALIPGPGRVARRPAPSSLAILENGGGKGVFKTSIESVMIPFRQAEAGRRALKDYVRKASAPAHAVLEWAHLRTGQLLIIGHVFAPASEQPLDRCFYSLRPTANLDLTGLPFVEEGKRLRVEDYISALERLAAADPALEVKVVRGQKEWEGHLRGLGLEPDLFVIQQAMNSTEGGAVDALKTSSPRAFIDWLLRRAVDRSKYEALGQLFSDYATNLSRHEDFRLELQFSEAAHSAAAQLAGHYREYDAARKAAQHSGSRLTQLAGAVSAAVDVRASHTVLAGERLERAKSARANGEAKQRQAIALENEVKLRTALLVFKLATGAREALEAAKERLAKEHDAWRLVPDLLALEQALERQRQARSLIAAAEDRENRALNARDVAGAHLHAAYTGVIDTARHEAQRLEQRMTQQTVQAKNLDGQAAGLERSANQASGRISVLEKQAIQVRERLARAGDDGLVHDDEDIFSAASRIETSAEQAQNLASEAENAREAAESKASKAATQARTLAEPANQLLTQADQLRLAIERDTAAAKKLRDLPYIQGILEIDTSDTSDTLQWADQMTERLILEIRKRVNEDNASLTPLRQQLHVAERSASVLASPDGGLLPPRPEISAVLDILNRENIIAITGWQWLHQNVASSQHAAAIDAHPELVDGIVVNDSLDIARARELLSPNPLWPGSTVAVGEAKVLLDAVEPDRPRYVLEPNPAMHDLQAARSELERLKALMTGWSKDVQRLTERIAHAQAALAELSQWRTAVPEGTALARLQDLRHAEHLAGEAAETYRIALESADAAAAESSRLAELARQAQREAGMWQQRLTQAKELLQLATNEKEWQDEIATLADTVTTASAQAELLREQAEQLRQDLPRLAVAVEAHRSDESDYRSKQGKIATSPEAIAAVDGSPGQQPLSTLIATYDQAVTLWADQKIDADLMSAETEAAAQVGKLSERAQAQPEDLVGLARALMLEPAAQTEAGRDRAARAARTELHQREQEFVAAVEKAGKAGAEYESCKPKGKVSWVDDLPANWQPHDPTHGQLLLADAATARRNAGTGRETAENEETSAHRALEAARTEAAALQPTHERLAEVTKNLTVPTEVSPFAGTSQAARDEAGRAIAAFDDDSRKVHTISRLVGSASTKLRDTATDPRFQNLKDPIRTQIAALEAATLGPRAEGFAAQLESRMGSLRKDIATADEHRATVTQHLFGHVRQALKLLAKAVTLSKFPETAGIWAGKPFIKIDFVMADDQVLRDRVGLALDEAARETKKIDELDLVMRGVMNAVPMGFKVMVLKPHAARADRYYPVEQMADIFSGGQELTGAILLYCTLAVLRMSSTATGTSVRHGGLLLLDNPIGRANAPYLIQIQQAIASALGVQLLYTTGLQEDHVLAMFPNWIKLRNDNELRTGMSMLRVEERYSADLLPPPAIEGDDTPLGRVSSIRLQHGAR